MKVVPIGIKGLVVSGEHEGWFVEVSDDRDISGGFLIVFTKNATGINTINEAYDNWVESYEDVVTFFYDGEETEWVITWMNDSSS